MGYVDVWQWKATSGGPTGWMDDAHFGPPLDATPMQARNIVPYKGGFAPDPGASNYSDNFVISAEATSDDNRAVMPRRLPRDLAATPQRWAISTSIQITARARARAGS